MQAVLLYAIISCSVNLIAILVLNIWIAQLIKNDTLFNCLNNIAAKDLKELQNRLDIVKKIQLISEPAEESLSANKDIIFKYRIIPADRISGDIFGVYHISESETLFWIGDVMGHGIDAGLIMVAIQSIIQTIIRQNYANNLKDLLVRLNTAIGDVFDKSIKDSYSTSFLILRYINNSIKFSGYHENIIHYNSNKKLFSVVDTSEFGINLGTISSSKDISKFIEYGIIEFSPGDTLILYSDGLLEAQNPEQEQYGLTRFIKSLTREFMINKRDRTSEEVIDHLIADVKIFSGPEKFKDDVTLIVINNIKKDC
jgi:serine phosphatase RsbU (regulator of sigma subunit)